MAGQVYFGNATYQSWIDAPLSGMKVSNQGYMSEQQLLNGRSFVRRSRASHKVFSASWTGSMNGTLAPNLKLIQDFCNGVYGDGPFYWIDPFAAEQNILPFNWSYPGSCESDWPSISASLTPAFLTSSYSNKFPNRNVIFNPTAGFVDTRKLTVIIPPTHTLHFGWHAQAAGLAADTSAGIRITPYNLSGVAQADVNPISLLAGGTTRTNQSFAGSSYSKIEIFLANGSASTVAVRVVAMIAQVLLTGTSVATGGFISGSGTTGLQFSQFPEIEYYSSKINDGQIGMSVTWTEV